MSVTLPTTPGPSASDEVVPTATEQLAPVVSLARRRPIRGDHAEHAGPVGHLAETGAASAEYAAVTACGVGLAGVLMKLLSSDFGQQLLESVLKFFLGMVGIG